MNELTEHEKAVITKYDLFYEQRLTRVETTLEKLEKNFDNNFKEIKSDLRWMLSIMGTIGLIIVAVMAHDFHWF